MSILSVPIREFQNSRLNLSTFVDGKLNQITKAEFINSFDNGDFEIYDAKSIAKFLNSALNNIEKAEITKITAEQLKGLVSYQVDMGNNEYQQFFVKKIEKSTQDDLQKAEDIEKGLSHEFRDIKIEKTGKEIKEKLTLMVPKLQSQCDKMKSKMNKLVEEIGCKPDQEADHYEIDRYGDDVPNRYSYECCYDQNKDVVAQMNSGNQIVQTETLTEDQRNMCRQYNDLRYKCMDVQADIKYLNTLIENMDDKEKVKLSAELAMKIGF